MIGPARMRLRLVVTRLRPAYLGELNFMDVRRILALIVRRAPIVIACTLVAAIAALGATSFMSKVYEARATLIVGQSLNGVNPDYTQLLASQSLATTYATVATTRPNAEAVVGKLGLTVTPDDLLKHVTADSPFESTIVNISASDGDPARAAAIANAFADQLVASSPAVSGHQTGVGTSIQEQIASTQRQIKATQTQIDQLSSASTPPTTAAVATLTALQDRMASLEGTYATLLAASASNASNAISVIEPAIAPGSPVSPRPVVNLLGGALLGFLIGLGIVLVLMRLTDSVDDPDQIRELTGLSTLGMVGRMRGGSDRSEIYRLATVLYPRSSAAEAYRSLRTNLDFASVDQPLQSLLITSSVPGEGKTVTAANLAVACAQAGRRVVLVDADLRKPGAHALFDLPNEQGLTTLLRDQSIEAVMVAQNTEVGGLHVITSGPTPPNPSELLGSQRMRHTLERLVRRWDLVILDSPPINAVTDPAILSSITDGTLLVVDAQKAHPKGLRQAYESLGRASSRVLGAMLNRVSTSLRGEYAGYEVRDEKATTGPDEAAVQSSPAVLIEQANEALEAEPTSSVSQTS
jgi:non-specific protein-tyrosine kinase